MWQFNHTSSVMLPLLHVAMDPDTWIPGLTVPVTRKNAPYPPGSFNGGLVVDM